MSAHPDHPSAREHAHGNDDAPARVIGSVAGFAIVAGSMLGIGIFLVPAEVAGYLQSPWAFLLMWVVGGVLAFAGAVACAELGAMLPRAGGDYVFQREAFGPSVAFASGWVLFGAIFTGSIAAMGVSLAKFQLPVLLGSAGWETPIWHGVTGAQLIGVGLILGVTALNSLGTRLSAGAQTLLTLVPLVVLAGLAVLVVTGWIVPQAAPSAPLTAPREITMGGIVLAYVAVYFAYSGWNSVIYVAGEVRTPGRTLPRALLGGTVVVTALYLLLCAAFLVALGMDGVRSAGEAGTATAGAIAGDAGRVVVTSLIAMALLAGLNGTVLGGARVLYAMSQGGAFARFAGHISPRTGAPVRALWLQAAWASILVVSGSFEEIISLSSLAMMITGSLTIASLFILRWRFPDRPRPYRAAGYPWLPGLYLLSSAVVIAVMLARAMGDTPRAWFPLLGLAILAAAYATHRLWSHRQGHAAVMLAATATAAGFLVVRGANAEPAPRPTPAAALDELAAAAARAKGSPTSEAARRLYDLVACRPGGLTERRPPVSGYADYCRGLREVLSDYRQRVRRPATPWLAARRPKDLPPTVLYPFAGADLAASLLVFPDAHRYAHVSLEAGGPPTPLEELAPRARGAALLRTLDAARELLDAGSGARPEPGDAPDGRLTGLRGILPLTLITLAAFDGEVVSLRYFQLGESGRAEYLPDALPAAAESPLSPRWANFELAFQLPGDRTVRILQYVAANLHDSRLARTEEAGTLTWVRALGQVGVVTKASSYLLWGEGFAKVRELIREQGVWLVTDASGPPPSDLPARDWDVAGYGSFRCDALNWHAKGGRWAAVNDALAAWFEDNARPAPPFPFGYLDCQGHRSLLIARHR